MTLKPAEKTPVPRCARSARARWPVVFLGLAFAGCGGQESGPTAPTPTLGVPTLLAPDDYAFFRQNDPETGCRADPVWGYGFRVPFAWTPVRNATAYRVQMMHPDAFTPLVNEVVSAPQYELRRCTTVLGYGDNWKWKVRAIFASGAEGDWSATRTINFTECWIGDRPCGDQSLGGGR
jgi:hypothetical protein